MLHVNIIATIIERQSGQDGFKKGAIMYCPQEILLKCKDVSTQMG